MNKDIKYFGIDISALVFDVTDSYGNYYQFKNIKLPQKEIRLNQCTSISNLNKFITSHLVTVRANNGNLLYLPYLIRLQELKHILLV